MRKGFTEVAFELSPEVEFLYLIHRGSIFYHESNKMLCPLTSMVFLSSTSIYLNYNVGFYYNKDSSCYRKSPWNDHLQLHLPEPHHRDTKSDRCSPKLS